MTPQELKNSILQLAIQGKLVEQRRSEGTAEELYKQIQAEKQALIKAGKIKKEKPLPELTEDEIPFEIPESWKWVRLGSAFCLEMGQSPDGTSVSETTDGMEFHQGKVFFGKQYLQQSPQRTSAPTKIAEPNSVLLCVRAPVGKVNITTRRICIGRGLCSVLPVAGVGADFVFYLLATFENTFIRQATGTTFIAITGEIVKNQPIPLPPLAEQKRIVAKIEELLPLIERYEKAWSRLEDFNKRFPVDMQKSILQMAIQGKLVEQRPEEGTGEELCRQIQAEKQALIKAGKIKKEKPLSEITEDEIPFEIPESWKWVRIGEVFSIVNGFTPLKSNPEFWTNGEIPWFTIEDVHRQGRFISSTEKYISKKALSKNTERIVPPDSVLLCCTASVGEYAYTKIPLTTNQQFNAFVTKPEFVNAVFPMFVYEFAKTLKDTLIRNAGKTTFNFLSVGKLSLLLFPLPPLAEQKRIVARLEELLPLCERLK